MNKESEIPVDESREWLKELNDAISKFGFESFQLTEEQYQEYETVYEEKKGT